MMHLKVNKTTDIMSSWLNSAERFEDGKDDFMRVEKKQVVDEMNSRSVQQVLE